MTALAPQGGLIAGREFLFPVRVYYEDTDAGAVVYHAAYLGFAERARSEFLRAIGWPHGRLLAVAGATWAVHRLAVEYRQPARLDDALVVATSLTELGGASVELLQVIRRDGNDLARLTVRLALLSQAGRPMRIPPALGAALIPFTALQESPSEPCKSIP